MNKSDYTNKYISFALVWGCSHLVSNLGQRQQESFCEKMFVLKSFYNIFEKS